MGQRSEFCAVVMLSPKGCRILTRYFRVPVREIDIMSFCSATLVFVEVRARRDGTNAMAVVSERQWERIAGAVEWFAIKNFEFADFDWRFDMIAMQPWYRPQHLPDAWRPFN